MPTYKAKQKGYHDDIIREPGAVFASQIVYGGKDTPPLPTWLELISDHEDVPVDDGSSRDAKILNAMKEMVAADPERLDPESWIGNGSPEIKKLVELTGLSDISAQERDNIWAKVYRPPSGKTPIA